ncbi:protein SPA, chloroplastic [Amborella trichopoda]|uniref:protein SPA, chloroplastic n=1 Tax=Amborella trichopoda TaxID=13333 RepID=UPI0009C0FFF6|nr:protein SPA, chloroplastic [Amborella trichopoda]|eukprot:XP_006857244.3 protein SPA, chloroplastic [Amborella trichopoda]
MLFLSLTINSSAMSLSPSLPRLNSSFISNSRLKLFSSPPKCTARIQRPPSSYPCINAIDLDQNTVVAISVGVVSIAVGIGIPVFYESQIDNAAKRENKQPCFPCDGTGAQRCRFCMGTGNVTVELSGGEKEVSRCINCEGVGSLTCTTCQGTGIQPRYLDRREFKDED